MKIFKKYIAMTLNIFQKGRWTLNPIVNMGKGLKYLQKNSDFKLLFQYSSSIFECVCPIYEYKITKLLNAECHYFRFI